MKVKPPKEGAPADPYDTKFYRGYRGFLAGAIGNLISRIHKCLAVEADMLVGKIIQLGRYHQTVFTYFTPY